VVNIKSTVAKKLKLATGKQISPLLEKCCWLLSANESYQRAEEDLEMLMAIRIGHSTLHRLVQKAEFDDPHSRTMVESLSVDGGKVCLRSGNGKGEWRDYKAVSLHGSVCGAYFQDNEGLITWVNQQRLASMVTCLGDGHDGVWNIINKIGDSDHRREVLDWYHLVENLYRVGGSLKKLKKVKNLLWYGLVEEGLEEWQKSERKAVINFRAYTQKHRQRIVDYQLYQQLGIEVGSGSVESKVKQIGHRIKLTGAQGQKENVPQILRLRCAYLNGEIKLSISA
jgi:hypothetical protein